MSILHYFLIRKIVKMFIFKGGNPIFQKMASFNLGMYIIINKSSSAEGFSKQISDFKEILLEFKYEHNQIPFSLLDFDSKLFVLKNTIDSISSYLRISNQVNSNYGMNKLQRELSLQLHILKMSVDDSRIIRKITQAMKDLEKDKYQEIRNASFDANIEKILINVNLLMNILDNFTLKKCYLYNLFYFIFNESMGSAKQIKVEIMNRFDSEELSIKTEDNNTIDALLLRTNIIYSESNSRGNSKPNSRENSLTNLTNIAKNIEIENINEEPKKVEDKEGTKEKSLMVICCPSSTSYQMFAYTEKWVDYYLENGVNVLLWNYRGYGDSTGSADFNNIVLDAETVVNHVKKNYKFQNVGVHGISIGGIPACHLAS